MVDQTVLAGALIVEEPCQVQTPLVGGMLGVSRLGWVGYDGPDLHEG